MAQGGCLSVLQPAPLSGGSFPNAWPQMHRKKNLALRGASAMLTQAQPVSCAIQHLSPVAISSQAMGRSKGVGSQERSQDLCTE